MALTRPLPPAPGLTPPGVHAPRGVTPTHTAPPPPTEEQTRILDAYQAGEPIVVEALAGTGKTTTLRQLAAASGPRRGLYLAFNRAIVREAEGRFPSNVQVTTAHSLAYRAVGRDYAHRLSTPRIYAREIAHRWNIKASALDEVTISPVQRVRLADALIRRFISSADPEPGPQHLTDSALIHGSHAQMWEVVGPVAQLWWRDLCKTSGTLPFSHDVYLKLWQLRNPQLAVDYVLFDEAQDADPVIAHVVASQAAQVVYVGDRNQQLYAWRGAVDAMALAPGRRLALTHSFRFGPEIAGEANRWLQRLGSPHQVVGRGPAGTIREMDGAPDAILCRTNGTALAAVLRAHEDGVPVSLAPGDKNAGKDILAFAWAARDLQAGRGTDHPELCGFQDWAGLVKYVEEEESGADLKRLVGIINRLGYPSVIDAVRKCVLAEQARLMVSTAHKSKGLEWDRVKVADDFTPPEDDEEPSHADLMLAYVTVTRAKRHLDTGSLNPVLWGWRSAYND